MNAIILALGGVRSTIFCGLAIVFLLAAGVQTWRLGNTQDAYSDYRDKVVAATAKSAQAAATAREKSLEAREAYLWKSGEAENAYQAGRESAINYQNTVVADLRSGNIRLRNEWQSCMQRPIPPSGPVADAPSGSDEGASVPAEAFGRVLRIGADADNAVRWYQAELIATRELYGKCMVPKTK